MANSSADSERVRRWEPRGGDDLGELVVRAWVFDADRTHVLMVDHHLFDVWVHPGGRAAPGEDPLAAAAGELLEETGATGVPVSTSPALVDAIDRVSPDGRPVTTFGAAFVFRADRTHPFSPEDGQPARCWRLPATGPAPGASLGLDGRVSRPHSSA